MYRYFLPILKKSPFIYKSLKKIKNEILFKDQFINNLRGNTDNLVASLINEKYFEYQKKNFHKIKDKKTKVGILEINNSCNINCVMCDTKSSTRQKKLMNVDLAEKSVKEMRNDGIDSVLLHTIGDPLANVKLKEYLKILRKYKMQAGLSTNGLMLDKHVNTLAEYIDVCSNIRFSIDGVKKETYEKIRFGGIFEKLIENLDLAEKKLKKIGYEFSIDLVITKDNFDELGEFVVFFKKYVNNPYKNIHFNFMNSLSPNNDYFLENNVIEEHTSKNYYCNYASRLIPYVLVDGRVSACCRDYDGSLVVDDLKNNSLINMNNSKGFKKLQKAHMDEDESINEYELCKSCYIVDERITTIWRNVMTLFLYKNPDGSAKFYQKFFDELLLLVKNLNKIDYDILLKKYSLA
tara:strand:- start:177 stop:1394 length:1218 start_codon:yes stop_codon:yes gene_type:complete